MVSNKNLRGKCPKCYSKCTVAEIRKGPKLLTNYQCGSCGVITEVSNAWFSFIFVLTGSFCLLTIGILFLQIQYIMFGVSSIILGSTFLVVNIVSMFTKDIDNDTSSARSPQKSNIPLDDSDRYTYLENQANELNYNGYGSNTDLDFDGDD